MVSVPAIVREVWLVDIKLDTKEFFSSPVQVAVSVPAPDTCFADDAKTCSNNASFVPMYVIMVLTSLPLCASSLLLQVTCEDSSGEDPMCHSGQCSLGVCTSTYNHVHGYFGLYLGADNMC